MLQWDHKQTFFSQTSKAWGSFPSDLHGIFRLRSVHRFLQYIVCKLENYNLHYFAPSLIISLTSFAVASVSSSLKCRPASCNAIGALSYLAGD